MAENSLIIDPEFHSLIPPLKRSQKTGSSIEDRLLPCSICNYPLSRKHHLLQVHNYGENQNTMRLCSNCHELYHLIYNALKYWERSERLFKTRRNKILTKSQHIWVELATKKFKGNETFDKIDSLVRDMLLIEKG